MPEKKIEGGKSATVPTEIVELEGVDGQISRETSLKGDGRRITYYSRTEVGKSGD